ncbi:hypothetical protein LUZ60_013023 [Juncus effusus]|nr:hypothetical protein LUZ60_013023 [Juncus effusus]
MSKLVQLRNAFRSMVSSQNRSSPVSSPWMLAPMRRYLSAEAESGAPASETDDSFLRSANEGLVYGRIATQWAVGKNMLKTDVIHLLEGCDLSIHDVKFDYNRAFYQTGILLQFPSKTAFNKAITEINKKGRFYRLDQIDRSQWDMKNSFDGKAILMQGVPRNATQEDIERCLSGCNYEPSSFQSFIRLVNKSDQFAAETGEREKETVRVVVVKFPSQIDATNAFISKHRNFCLNSPISVRVLQ